MAKNVLVITNKNEVVAKAYLDKACKDATYLGTALVHEGKLVVDHQGGKPTVEQVMKLQDALKDRQIVFCFGENKTILDTDRQPFRCVLDKAKGDEIAVFLTGGFNGYEVKNSSHTNEFHCFDDFISKKLAKLYKMCDGDLTKLVEELNDPITKQDFAQSWTTQGFITLLTSAGDIYEIHNKTHAFRKEFPWGVVSDGLGFEPGKEKESPKAEEPKKLSLLEKLMLKKAGGTPPAEASVAGIIANLPSSDEFEDVSLPVEAGASKEKWTNAQKITWWQSEVGYKPERYKEMDTKVRRKIGTKLGVLAPLAASNVTLTNAEVKNLPDVVAKEAPEGVKDTAPKHVLMDNMPILSPKQKLKLHTEWMKDAEIIKVLGDDFKTLAYDPKKLKEFEDTYQKFTDGMGIPDDVWLSFEALLKLGVVDIKALAIKAFNDQNDKVKAELRLKSIIANPANKIASAVAM